MEALCSRLAFELGEGGSRKLRLITVMVYRSGSASGLCSSTAMTSRALQPASASRRPGAREGRAAARRAASGDGDRVPQPPTKPHCAISRVTCFCRVMASTASRSRCSAVSVRRPSHDAGAVQLAQVMRCASERRCPVLSISSRASRCLVPKASMVDHWTAQDHSRRPTL
jgi:hypothetical protein